MIDTKFEGRGYPFKVKFNGKLSNLKLTERVGFLFFDKSELDRLKVYEL